MQVNAPPSFFQGSYLVFSCQEHKITSMDCEGLSKEEIQAAAAELTYLQTSALKGAAFGATFSPPQVAAPLTPATDPFRSQPSTPFSNFSGTTLVPTPTHGPLQETPSKFQKPAPSPFKGQGKGMGAREAAPSTQEDQSQEQSNRAKRRQQQQLKTRGQHGAPAQSSGASSSTGTLVQQMAALLLRHEDQFGVLAQSTAWVMFMGTAPPLSVVAPMAAVASQWHKDQRERPGSLKFPLRVLLFQSFLHSMGQALEKLTNDPAYKAEAIRLEILQEPDQLPFLRWNPEVRQVEVLASQMPLKVAEVAQMLQELMVLSAAPGVITRFHSTRKLSEELAGPTITFKLEVGLRETKTFRFWQILESLSGNSALRLVAASMRQEKMARSPLAMRITEAIRRQLLSCIASDNSGFVIGPTTVMPTLPYLPFCGVLLSIVSLR